MKSLYITIALVFTLSVTAVATLYFLQPGPAKNGFDRGHMYSVKKLNEQQLRYNYWYITWLGEGRVYLGNYKATLNLFSCNYHLQDTLYQKLGFADGSRLRLESLKSQIVAKLNPKEDSFSRDGYVTLDETTGRMVYTYYYKNAFVYLDSSLNVLHTGQLIDTNSVAKIEVAEVKDGRYWMRTVSAPAVVVNKRGYTDGRLFYNHAALAGDNESLKAFDAREVIDVYLLSGGYSHSIYLPKYPGRKLTDFVVRGNTLIALYEKVLVSYQLTGKEVRQAR